MADKRKSRIDDDERRESPRVPMTFLVRGATSRDSEWEERSGDLSLGGIYWKGTTAPAGMEVEVRFRLPAVTNELRARGEIIRVRAAGQGIDFHVRFTALELDAEMAIAKFLDEHL